MTNEEKEELRQDIADFQAKAKLLYDLFMKTMQKALILIEKIPVEKSEDKNGHL